MRYSKSLRVAAWVAVTAGAGLLLSVGAGQMTPPGAVPLRVIIVPTQAEAAQVLEQLKSGADFSVMARLRSKDPTAADGGYMGEMRPGSLRPELAEALKGVGPRQIWRRFLRDGAASVQGPHCGRWRLHGRNAAWVAAARIGRGAEGSRSQPALGHHQGAGRLRHSEGPPAERDSGS